MLWLFFKFSEWYLSYILKILTIKNFARQEENIQILKDWNIGNKMG